MIIILKINIPQMVSVSDGVSGLLLTMTPRPPPRPSNFCNNLQGRSYTCPYFTGEKSKALRGHRNLPKDTHAWVVLAQMFSLKMLMSQPYMERVCTACQ